MKCTLRKVEGGIVATIDERPKREDWSYDFYFDIIAEIKNDRDLWAHNDEDCHKIIASTIPNVGKEFVVDDESIGFLEELEFDKEYEYTETETQVIIKI